MSELDTITCSDALEYLKVIPDESIDMILTSPPYDNLRTYKGYTWDFEGIARDSYRVLKTGGVLVWVVGDATIDGSETFTSFRQALYFKDVVGFRAHDTMIYQKNMTFPETTRYQPCFDYMFVFSKGAPKTFNPLQQKNRYVGEGLLDRERQPDGSMKQSNASRMGKRTKETGNLNNVWYISSGYMKTTTDAFAYEHPAMFPEKLAERHIMTWTNAGDTVLDYFCGSGTTLKMARNLNRRYLGCDISEDYVRLAQKRLSLPYTVGMFTD